MVGYVLLVIAGYLIGSVNSAILLVWRKFHKDVRNSGSGNAGATNVARVFGVASGLLTLGCDMAKAVIASLLGWFTLGHTGLMAAGLACLLGHCWPVFFRFRGGKGIAVGAGVILVLDIRLFLIEAVLFVLLFVIWRRVSLCSVVCAATFPAGCWFLFGWGTTFVLSAVMCVIVEFQHRTNIARLIRGQEPRFDFHSGGK